MDSFGPIRLQRLHNLLAREKRLRLFAQLVDLLDLLVELGYLGLEQSIAAVLVLDARGNYDVNEPDDGQAQHREPDRQRHELPLPGRVLLLAVGKKVDPYHGYSKPRMASPQAISSNGASVAS